MKDYYAILEVGKNATPKEIKKSYRRLASLHHPDKNGNSKTDSFHEINEAYQVLSNREKKEAYDWEREFGSRAVQHKITFTQPPVKPATEVYQPFLKYARAVSLLSLVFCVLLALDYLLPQKEVMETVSKIEKQENIAGSDHKDPDYTAEVFTSSFIIPISSELAESFPPGSTITVYQTRIFSIFTKIERQLKGLKFTTVPDYSIYSIFIFLPVVLMICSVLGAFYRLSPDLNFSLGVVNLTLLIITFVITLL